MSQYGATIEIDTLLWPAERLPEAVELLARRAGYPVPAVPAVPSVVTDVIAVASGDRVIWSAARLGLEVEEVTTPYPDRLATLRYAGPAVLAPVAAAGQVLLLLQASRRRVVLLGPDRRLHRLPTGILAAWLVADLEAPLLASLDQLLERAEVSVRRRVRARQLLLDQRLQSTQLAGCWLLRLSPAGGLWALLRHARVPGLLVGLGLAYAVRQGLQILGWILIVKGALAGHIDMAWLQAWALVLLTMVPVDLLGMRSQNRLTINIGQLLKQRLLFGTLQLRSDEVRHQGIGQLLGRVLDAETLETLLLVGGFAALIGVIELISAVMVMGSGAGGWLQRSMLLLWFMTGLLLSWRLRCRSECWRTGHRHLINDLVERMVGHRTRLAQESSDNWHRDEDQMLAGYFQLSREYDHAAIGVRGLLDRGWLLLGLSGLAYSLLMGQPSAVTVAITLGGVMLATQAFNNLSRGVESLVDMLTAWREVGPLFRAATRARSEGRDTGALLPTPGDRRQPLLEARDLEFRYQPYGQPVLAGCDLQIHPGDRLLLEGSSGGGKSTLVALLAGLRMPTAGRLRLHGLDQQTFGSSAWRRRVVSAPQFHDNYVLTETLAFNLLMGRRWPPSPQDLQDASAICQELGLGPLLAGMPAGLQEMVGDGGWRLSHGERSRIFIARALLQDADLVVLDESFAALDAENLERAMRCVLRRAPTLLVIAHP